LTLDLSARVTRGLPMPFEEDGDDPGDVLLLSAEDDPARTIRPRLDAIEADVSRVHILSIRVGDPERPPMLPNDFDWIETVIAEKRVRLVVIDPIMAYVDAVINTHRDQDVRLVMHRLSVLAGRTQAAVVLVRHLNKMTTCGDAIYRGGGSIG